MEPWTKKQCEADDVRRAARRLQAAENAGAPPWLIRELARVAIAKRDAFKAKYGHAWNEVKP